MTRNLRRMYSVVGALLLLEFLAQFYTIASSGFTSVASKIANAGNPSAASAVDEIDLFGAAHAVIGVFVVPITIVALIIFLGVAALAGLHGINALVMVGFGTYLVRRNWALWSQTPASTQPNGI